MYVDTLTGEEWRDSSAMMIQGRVPKMEFPLLHSLSVSLNLWDPAMRIFGQHYGIADASVELNMHNRYLVNLDLGLGKADYTPEDNNFTYRSPLSFFFRIGASYNFFFNSNPDYMIFGGLRYGFSPFSYSVDNITLDSPYWDESVDFSIPSRHATAGWGEVTFGLRVKLWGPLSAGWAFKYQKILHESRAPNGRPWYIPGFGSRGNSVSGSFSVTYSFSLSRANKEAPEAVISEDSASPESEKITEQEPNKD